MSKVSKNEYLILFGFLSKEELLKFRDEKSGQYDVMKLIKTGDNFLSTITNYNCSHWLISKLHELTAYIVTLDKIDIEEK